MPDSSRATSVLVAAVIGLSLALAVSLFFLFHKAAGAAGQSAGGGFFTGYPIFDETMVEMAWPAVEKAAKDGAVVMLPVAVVEEHGPHLSLGTDIYFTSLFCKLIRRELEAAGVQAVVAPPYYWGVNVSTGWLPGSFTARPETMKAAILDELSSLKNWGFKRFFVVNFHGDPAHRTALADTVNVAGDALGISVLTLNPAIPYQGLFDVHAGAFETGFMAEFFPGEVDAHLARTLKPQSSFYPAGYYGDPARFTTKGMKKAVEEGAMNAAAQIRERIQAEG